MGAFGDLAAQVRHSGITTTREAAVMGLQIALVAVLILINALLSGSEMALVTLRESQVHRLQAESERGQRLAALVADPNRFLSTIQVGITLAGFLASATAAVSLSNSLVGPLGFLGDAAEPAAVVVVTVLLSYLTLVFGELAPKRMALQRAERWSLAATGGITVLAGLFRPLIWLLGKSTEGIVRLFGLDPHAVKEEVSEEEIRDIIAGQESMPPEQRSIVEGALQLDERKLWQVIVPRADVFFLNAGQDAAGARDRLIEAGFSRAPVIGESEDDVVGFAHLRQLVAGVGSVSDYVRPALVLPDSAGVLHALGRMQQQRGQLALVVDEFGSVAGIVTLEDLLEEIVGEIYDEFDLDTSAVVRTDDGEIELDGSFPAHDLADLGVGIDTGRNATVAGIMLEELGEFPAAGTAVRVQGWRLTALEVTPRAILRIRLAEALEELEGPDDQDGADQDGADPTADRTADATADPTAAAEPDIGADSEQNSGQTLAPPTPHLHAI
jgi:putative hemolysin